MSAGYTRQRYIRSEAPCPDEHAAAQSFRSFDKDDKGLAFEYADGTNDHYMMVVYRLDDGERLFVTGSLNAIRYIKMEQVTFCDWRDRARARRV